MKWKNVDIGAGCYYITGTCTEWLPLPGIPDVRQRVCGDIEEALGVRGRSLGAFVIMPTQVRSSASPARAFCTAPVSGFPGWSQGLLENRKSQGPTLKSETPTMT